MSLPANPFYWTPFAKEVMETKTIKKRKLSPTVLAITRIQRILEDLPHDDAKRGVLNFLQGEYAGPFLDKSLRRFSSDNAGPDRPCPSND